MSRTAGRVRVEAVAPDGVAARAALRLYFDDVASRYYGRQATGAEIDEALADDPSDDLVPPDGVLLVALADADADAPATVVGCAGLRVLPGGIGEVCRVFVTTTETLKCSVDFSTVRSKAKWEKAKVV